jgi:trimethylamine--corrinoid protein Co-methyltransferase
VQAGHEKTLTALMAALAGANLIYGAGMTESGVTFDYAQYVLDNDVARMVKHTVLGVPVSDELSQPRLMDRRVREDWEAAGARDAYAVAREAAKQILEEHHPDPLPGEVADQIDAVVKEAEERGREQ